jgi:enoyl-CoA hydratase/carnithine racemase
MCEPGRFAAEAQMSGMVQVGNDDGIWTVRINRPEVRNVFSTELMRELTEVARRLQDEPGARAVVLAASGPNFTAGADLKDPRRWELDQAGLAARRSLPQIGERMCQAWEDIPAVTIAAVEGYCIGGGTALAVSLDFRVIARPAYFQLPEIAIGLPLSWGAVPRLVRLLGPAGARRAVILCDKFPGPEAVEAGLADVLAEAGKAYDEALVLARRVAALPDTAVKMSKEAINVTANALNRLASYMARDQLALAAHSEEAVEARKRFAAKKKPRA